VRPARRERIATNASGMKKNRYGNIEDIVIEATGPRSM
jgi:hypothetical protein